MSLLLDFDQGDINRRMRPWGDAEHKRYAFRSALFKRRGLSESDAERAADRLAARDADLDERRICCECSNFQRSRTCAKRLPTSPLQLVRCNGFSWVTP